MSSLFCACLITSDMKYGNWALLTASLFCLLRNYKQTREHQNAMRTVLNTWINYGMRNKKVRLLKSLASPKVLRDSYPYSSSHFSHGLSRGPRLHSALRKDRWAGSMVIAFSGETYYSSHSKLRSWRYYSYHLDYSYVRTSRNTSCHFLTWEKKAQEWEQIFARGASLCWEIQP